jgi:hypothetical protein
MRKDAQPPTGGIYRPRHPRASPLYQCVRRHSDDLDAAGLVHRPVEAEVLERFLDCGDLHKGFARVFCDLIDLIWQNPQPRCQLSPAARSASFRRASTSGRGLPR